jgi:hypothetical protein
MEFLVVLLVLALLVLFVTHPLWRRSGGERRAEDSGEVAELEAARDAKYREIRDAELDLRTGKLSREDFEAIDRSLRAEAVEILKALDQARERVNGGGTTDASERLPSRQR